VPGLPVSWQGNGCLVSPSIKSCLRSLMMPGSLSYLRRFSQSWRITLSHKSCDSGLWHCSMCAVLSWGCPQHGQSAPMAFYVELPTENSPQAMTVTMANDSPLLSIHPRGYPLLPTMQYHGCMRYETPQPPLITFLYPQPPQYPNLWA